MESISCLQQGEQCHRLGASWGSSAPQGQQGRAGSPGWQHSA